MIRLKFKPRGLEGWECWVDWMFDDVLTHRAIERGTPAATRVHRRTWWMDGARRGDEREEMTSISKTGTRIRRKRE